MLAASLCDAEPMKIAKLNLDDLAPTNVDFELSKYPGVKFTLGAFTLRVQLWLTKRFGEAAVQSAITGVDLTVVSETAYHVLDAISKAEFKTVEDFQEAIVSFKDRHNLKKALLETMGLSQPVLDKIQAQLEAKDEGNVPPPQAGDQPTGESSSTSSATPTPGAVPNAS